MVRPDPHKNKPWLDAEPQELDREDQDEDYVLSIIGEIPKDEDNNNNNYHYYKAS